MAQLVTGLGGSAGFGEQGFYNAGDDDSLVINLQSVFGSGLNFFGTTYTQLYLNTNGSVTFGDELYEYTPEAITGSTSNPIIAPYWGDVDVRSGSVRATPGGTSTGSNQIHYDLDTTTGTATFTWDDVGYYSYNTSSLNAFQLQLINRSSVGTAGDFDIVFRYEDISWTRGSVSYEDAHAGYSSGNGVNYFELPQSGNQASLLNLDTNVGNTGVAGLYVFQVRNGAPSEFGNSTIGSGNSDTIQGSNGWDQLAGGEGNDTINGGAGYDSITGNAGDDVLFGGADNDTLVGGQGNDLLTGGLGDDSIDGGLGNDTVVFSGNLADYDVSISGTTAYVTGGSDGNDTIANAEYLRFADQTRSLFGNDSIGSGGNDTVGSGGNDSIGSGNLYDGDSDDNNLVAETDGDDTMRGFAGNDTLNGAAGADNIDGGSGDDSLIGLSGRDLLVGGIGNDTMSGGIGNDTLRGGFNADRLSGGAGEDLLFGAEGRDVVRGEAGNDTIDGGNGFDSLDGGSGADSLSGGAFNDTLIGGDGADTLWAGAGDDSLIGGIGTDVFYFNVRQLDGVDVIRDFSEGDRLQLNLGDPTLSVQDFFDEYVTEADGSVVVYLGDGRDASTVVLSGVSIDSFNETDITGLVNAADDIVTAQTQEGDEENNTLAAESNENYYMRGFRGDDTLTGGDGSDRIIGDSGDDTLVGRASTDRLVGGAGNDSLDGGIGDDSLRGGIGFDTLLGGAGADDLFGGDNGDRISGNAGDDVIRSGRGHDTVMGGSGNDTVRGAQGNDTISGEDGNDYLRGDLGSDTLRGGLGADTFIFSITSGTEANLDVISDFSVDSDHLIIEAGPMASLTVNDIFDSYMSVDDVGNLVISFGVSNSITLTGVNIDQFSQSLNLVSIT